MRCDAQLSLHAACAVIESHGIDDDGMVAILRGLKAGQLIQQSSFTGPGVMQSDLDRAIRKHTGQDAGAP